MHTILVGMNAVDLTWIGPAAQKTAIAQMVKGGVKAVRLGLTLPYDACLSCMEFANECGIKILLIVTLDNPRFYASGVQRRKGAGGQSSSFPLSLLDIRMFYQEMREITRELDIRNINLIGIELGNELNWAGFNGDLRSQMNGTDTFETELGTPTETKRFQEGMKNYVAALGEMRRLLKASLKGQSTLLISAGLATVPREWAKKTHGDCVSVEATLNILRGYGVDDVVDGYGLHLYPDSSQSPSRLLDSMISEIRMCHRGTKKCWVTEWGVAFQDTGCPAKEAESVAREIRRVYEQFFSADLMRHLYALFYFEWSGNSAFSVWRCGDLTAAGREAVRGAADKSRMDN